MNGLAIGRIAWKEFRQTLPVWIVLTAFCLFGMVWMIFDQPAMYLRLSAETMVMLSLIYGLTAAAISFSSERENGTDRFLAALPLRNRDLIIGKVSVIAIATVLLVSIVVSLSLVIDRFFSTHIAAVTPHAGSWFLSFVILPTIECLAWGLLFSFACRKSITAAALAIVFAFTSLSILIGLFAPNYLTRDQFALTTIVPHRLVVLSFVLIANAWLANRWLQTETSRRLKETLGVKERDQESGKRLLNQPSHAMRNLCLQSLHDNWILLLIVIPIAPFLMIFTLYTGRSEWVFFTSLFVPALAGFLVFRNDQAQRQQRFFVQQGEYPTRIWLSRILIWLPSVIACILIVFLLFWWLDSSMLTSFIGLGFYDMEQIWINPAMPESLFRLTTLGMMLFATGQMCSMYFRSWPLALGAILVTAPIGYGYVFANFNLDLPIWWTVWPIILCCFGVTWLRTPAWLIERDNFKAVAKPLTPLLVTIAVIFCLIPEYRYFVTGGSHREGLIRNSVGVSFSPTTQANNQLLDKLSSSRAPTEFDKSIEALAAPNMYRTWSFGSVENEVSSRIRSSLQDGKLDEAFDRIMVLHGFHSNLEIVQIGSSEFDYGLLREWLQHPKQTVKSIEYGKQRFHEVTSASPSIVELAKLHFLVAAEISSRDPRGLSIFRYPRHILADTPWEKKVYFYSADLICRELERQINRAERFIENKQPVRDEVSNSYNDWWIERIAYQTSHKSFKHWSQQWQTAAVSRLVSRRCFQTEMALVAWMLEHGHYPQSLANLNLPADSQINIDPWTATDFVYWPNGSEFDVFVSSNGAVTDYRAPAKIPLLMDTGTQAIRVMNRNFDSVRDYSVRFDYQETLNTSGDITVVISDYTGIHRGYASIHQLPLPESFEVNRKPDPDNVPSNDAN